MKELVSVCVPTFNGSEFLKESIESILNQTYRNLDILVIDDKSSDETCDIVKSYMDHDERIRLIKNRENIGLVRNWNKCIQQSNGEWIKFHFQDDMMNPNTIEKMMLMASDKKMNLILTDREYIFEKGVDRKYLSSLSKLSDQFKEDTIVTPIQIFKLIEEKSIEHNFLGEPILGLFHSDLIGRLGDFDEGLYQIVDFEFWLRIMCNEEVGFIPEKLHQFRIHKQSQGAKNMSKPGVNILDQDVINMAFKIATHQHFANVRESIGLSKVHEMFSYLFNDRLLHYGFFSLKSKIAKDVFGYFQPSIKVVSKALLKDFKKITKKILMSR